MGKRTSCFNAQEFLDSAGVSRSIVVYQRGEQIFSPGDPCDSVLYIQKGRVKLSVRSKTAREAVVAVLGPRNFFGERCLAGQPLRVGFATAIAKSTILRVDKKQMLKLLHTEHGLSDCFISHMLRRNGRIEEDLIEQLFDSCEKRLARALLLLARYGQQEKPRQAIPKMSQQTLSDVVGATRSRVQLLMARFKRLGFIDDHRKLGGLLRINSSLLSVVLQD